MVVPSERQVLFHEFYGTAFCDQLADDVLQILKAACKPVDRVDPQGVAFVQTGEAVLKLRPVCILPGCLFLLTPRRRRHAEFPTERLDVFTMQEP